MELIVASLCLMLLHLQVLKLWIHGGMNFSFRHHLEIQRTSHLLCSETKYDWLDGHSPLTIYYCVFHIFNRWIWKTELCQPNGLSSGATPRTTSPISKQVLKKESTLNRLFRQSPAMLWPRKLRQVYSKVGWNYQHIYRYCCTLFCYLNMHTVFIYQPSFI